MTHPNTFPKLHNQDQPAVEVPNGGRSAKGWRDLGVRPAGLVPSAAASGAGDCLTDPGVSHTRIAEAFRPSRDIPAVDGVPLAAQGEIRWSGMDSLKRLL